MPQIITNNVKQLVVNQLVVNQAFCCVQPI